MSTKPAADRLNHALAALSHLTAIALLGAVIVARLYYKELGLSRDLEFDKLAVLALSAALVLLGLVARRLAPQVTLLAFTLCASGALGLMVSPWFGVDVAAAVKRAVTRVVFRPQHADIFEVDERYGYRLRPNARGRERTADYDVVYTIDEGGHRITPSPPRPRGTVVLIGDSFTFGTGVADHEVYPHVLGQDYWRDVKVVNNAAGGWGIVQAYVALTDTLAAEPLPSMIIYAMIPDDQFRSYLRSPVTVGVRQRLEFVDGSLVMMDVPPAGPPTEAPPALVEKELAMNRAMLLDMHRKCAAKGLPFAVVLLQDNGRFAPDLIYTLGERQVPVVDLTRLPYERFTHDYHPNARDHRHIAQALFDSPITQTLYAAVGKAGH